TKHPSGATDTSKSGQELMQDAITAASAGRFDEARALLEDSTKRDPQNADAWVFLGSVYLERPGADKEFRLQAIQALRKGLEVNPHHQGAWRELGRALFLEGRYGDAAEAFRKQLEITPNQRGLNVAIGDSLMRAHRPAEAIPALEKAATEESPDTYPKLQLSRAYIQVGEQDKATLTLESFLKQHSGVMSRNSVADLLADEGALLPMAEEQSRQALAAAYDSLKKTRLEFSDNHDIQRSWKLASLWRTAGWIAFRRGDAEKAQRYLEAAWTWSSSIGTGDRLAQFYLKQGRSEDAVRIWAEALSTRTAEYPDVKLRFMKEVGDRAKAEGLIESHRLDTQEMRTVKIENPTHLAGEGEVDLLIGPGPKIEGIDMADGEQKLKKLEPQLKAASVPLRFPDSDAIRVIRNAALSCGGAKCTLVFIPPPAAQMFANDDF